MKRYLITALTITTFLFNGLSQTSITGCYLSGAMIDPTSTAGCGNGANYCNLASLFVPVFSPTACGTSTASGGVAYTKSSSWIIPAGCTATAQAEYKKRNYFTSPINPSGTGCSNCGMDGSPDGFQITQTGGVLVSQSSTIVVNVGTCAAYPALGTYTSAVATLSPGCNNADGFVEMIVTGGVITIGGTSNRADEILTYTINLSGTCGPSCSAVLPIELISFTGLEQNGKVKLIWETATEKNVNYFLIERSLDGVNFSVIGSVKAKNYSKGTTYDLMDDTPNKGINYYRLTNYDNDGAVGRPSMIALNIEGETSDFWYNQDDERLLLHYNDAFSKEKIQLLDLSGKIHVEVELNSTASNFQTEIPKHSIPPGLYILRSINGIEPVIMKVIIN